MTDFLQNSEDDLLIVNGDLAIVRADVQHQKDIIFFEKGWNHFAPTTGVGVQGWLNDSDRALGLQQAIRSELERDGQRVAAVRLTPTGIVIEAEYE